MSTGAAANRYLGFYWTLPVPWEGFTGLSDDMDAAVRASHTIRYQRERVRRYVAEEKGTLLAEIAFIDVQHDRATATVESTLQKHAGRYAGQATLLYVRFAEVDHWRPNIHLVHAVERLGLATEPLPPDPILIDGVLFDPARHFRQWRERDEHMREYIRAQAETALRAALAATPAARGRWQAIADQLERDGIRTVRGRLWTPEAVRKAAARSKC